MGITLAKEEMDTCERLLRPAWIVMVLTNDLFSWEKEYDAAIEMGLKNTYNSIWVRLFALISTHQLILSFLPSVSCREDAKFYAITDFDEGARNQRQQRQTNVQEDYQRTCLGISTCSREQQRRYQSHIRSATIDRGHAVQPQRQRCLESSMPTI